MDTPLARAQLESDSHTRDNRRELLPSARKSDHRYVARMLHAAADSTWHSLKMLDFPL
jgi:hypothetical protein